MAIALLHTIGWVTLVGIVAPQHLAMGQSTFDIGIGVTAYLLGVRHALDADHIAAIDNTTRKLAGNAQRPVSVGFWFAMGHSSIVFVLTILLVLCARTFKGSPLLARADFHAVTGIIGTIVSSGFLYAIAALNMGALRDIWRQCRGTHAGSCPDKRGLLNRLLAPMMNLITKPWQMCIVGLLFGLGFDTVTEVGLLVMSGAGAASGLPWYAILCLPVLFAAGMSLIDTIDGSFMNVAYEWALTRPIGRAYYNLTVTGLSVVVAVVIGSLEILDMIGDRLHFRGVFWRWIGAVDLNIAGLAIVGLFITAWGIALVSWKIRCHMDGRMPYRKDMAAEG
jgi:nickel/cobalt transporter (NiCoT) family protein